MEKRVSKVEALPRLAPEFRVAAYARVSSEKDAMRHSLSAQVSYYSKLIQSHPGWQYAGVYADEPISGTKDCREEFQRMLSDCRAGKINMIITKSISRFARNTVTLLETVRELKDLGIDVFFEEQNIHSKSADGELMLTILASYAQEESRSVSENMKWRTRYEKAQSELEQRNVDRQLRTDQRNKIKRFMGTLKDQPLVLPDWDEQLWARIAESITLYGNGKADIHFVTGICITVDLP